VAPALAAGDDVVDLVDRKLRDEHAEDDALIDHGCCHEGHRLAVRRQIVGEILQARRRRVGRFGAPRRGRRDIRLTIGAGMQRDAEIRLLLDRIDDSAALVIDQHEVGKTKGGRRGAHQRMVDRVNSAVGTPVARIVEQPAARRWVRIGDDVPVLKKVQGGPNRKKVLRRNLVAD
jgi:hypothetical protein